MRAQPMPKPFDHSWPAGMNMPVPVGVIRAAVASLLIAHDAQDARTIRLQHIDNNHPDATANNSQPTISRHSPGGRCQCCRSGPAVAGFVRARLEQYSRQVSHTSAASNTVRAVIR